MKIAVLSAAGRCGATASILLMAAAIAETQTARFVFAIPEKTAPLSVMREGMPTCVMPQ